MSSIFHERITLPSLRRRFNNRVFAIPEIQRLYVWDRKRVCELMDSIYNHYPIGVFLIWKTHGTRNVEIRNNNNTILPPFNLKNHYAEILIDGQQRLSSIYGILQGLTPDQDKNTEINFTKIFFDTDPSPDKMFIYSKRSESGEDGLISLHEILTEIPSTIKWRYRLSRRAFHAVKKCSDRFKSYKYHALCIKTTSIEEVRETFIRINSKGMTVGRADTLFAKTTQIGLRDLVANTRRSLTKNGLNWMRPEAFVYTLALANGETRIGKTALDAFQRKFEKKNIGRKEFQRVWKKYDNAFGLAADYLLQEFTITDYNLLPNDNIFTMLSLFHFWNGRRATRYQKRELNKWFWHTALGERYSGAAFNKNIPADVKFMNRLSRNAHTKYFVEDKINAIDFLKHNYKLMNQSASVCAFFLFLKLKKPRYLETGEPMLLDGASAIANRKDRHHIFPHSLLSRRFRSKWTHSLANICFLAADENQSISNNHPSVYLEDYRSKRNFGTILKSHLIPYWNNCGIWDKNVKRGFIEFLNQRSDWITSEIEKTAGFRRWKLFEKFDEIRRI
ncbi:MAG: DUF262 domain-containing protein [Chitinispirillaceae bacterium]|nr:DUF262 domain-containing protein [Chitinispirillaceae bacterium]